MKRNQIPADSLDPVMVWWNMRTDKKSMYLDDVCEGELTFNDGYVAKAWEDKESPFKEICQYPWTEVYKTMLNVLSGDEWKKYTIAKVIERYEQAVYDYYMESNNFMLVGHSSGFDSRIFSTLLKRVHDKHHKRNILFVCWSPEDIQFIKIMEHEGWDKSQYLCIDRDCLYGECKAFDFAGLWKQVNGSASIPISVDYLAIKSLIDKKIIDTNFVDYHGAAYFETIHRMKSKRIGGFLECECHSDNARLAGAFIQLVDGFYNLCINSSICDLVYNSKMLQGCKAGLYETFIKDSVLGFLDPKLKEIPCGNSVDYSAKVQHKTMWEILDAYNCSHYGRNIKPNLNHNGCLYDNSDFQWSHVTMASFMEHLIQKGCVIK